MRDSLRAVADHAESWSNWLDRRPLVILTLLAPLYAWLIHRGVEHTLGFDELHTYYIAQAPTPGALFDEIRHLDLNPPLIYLLVRASHAIFGASTAATRLPSLLAFFLAGAAVVVVLSRTIGAVWAASAIALLWFSPFFQYATEARPYALMLVFFSLTLLSWDLAIEPQVSPSKRAWALLGIFAGNSGMMWSHVLAPLSIAPFCVAELIRSYHRRRLDWALWAALLLPLGFFAVVIPFVRAEGSSTQPPVFRASFQKIVSFYGYSFGLVLPAVLAALFVAFPIAAWRPNVALPRRAFHSPQAAAFGVALLLPVLLNLIMMRTRGPFWDRYCITSGLIMYVVITLFVARECRLNRLAGLAALLAILGACSAREVYLAHLQSSSASQIMLDQIRPDLPFVVNAATTFLSMDHRENDAFLKRVYYLVDRPSALRYAHNDLFEGLPALKRYFPIRANIEPYTEFAAANRHFVVFGTAADEFHWLLRKLSAEGARVEKIGDYQTPYEDSLMYEVTLPEASH